MSKKELGQQGVDEIKKKKIEQLEEKIEEQIEEISAKVQLTDLLAEIDLQFIENITLEESMADYNMLSGDTLNDRTLNDNRLNDRTLNNRLDNAIDITKIKNKALQHAKNTVNQIEENHVAHNKTHNKTHVRDELTHRRNKIAIGDKLKRKKGISRNIFIPLVAILSLIGVVVASSFGQSSTLKNFFGELFPYEEQIQVLGMQQVKSGIIYTVEGAFIDNQTGLFIVSMTKEDGSSFDEGVQVRQMHLDMKGPNGTGWGVTSYLEDHNKKLVSIMNLSCSKALYNKELTLRTEDIIKRIDVVEPTTIDLSRLYETNQFKTLKGNEENWYAYDRQDGMNIAPVKAFEEFSVDDVRISERGLSILASYPDIEGIEDRWAQIYLVDTRTYEKYIPDIYTQWCEDEELNKKSFVFENVTVADLPYLKVQFSETYNIVSVDETWEVNFKLSKNSQVKHKRIWQKIKEENDTILLTEVDVSALGVTLRGYGKIDDSQNIVVKVLMKDGSEKELRKKGSSNGWKGVTYHFETPYHEENSIYASELINIEDVVGVDINGKMIKVS